MSEDSQTTSRDKPAQADKFIPPPMDPYATYLTPYERRQSPEPNPFIEFRRFADKQLSDIFTGFSTFANLPKMFGMDDGMKNLRDQLQKDFKEMAALEKAWEDRFKSAGNDVYRPIPPSATAAISSSPSQSNNGLFGDSLSVLQKLAEELTRDIGKTVDYSGEERIVRVTGDDGKRYYINTLTGHANEELPRGSVTPRVPQQEDPKTRWRRGFQNCPELKKYQGETELDVYEALEDQQRSSKPTESSSRIQPSWSSWLPAYGYDGKQKAKNPGEIVPGDTDSQHDGSSVRPCEVKTYRAGQTRRMDPLRNDHEFLPWIVLSPYSPLSLANPEWANVKSARLHNGCEGGCSNPMHIYSHRYQDNSITEEDDKLRSTLADHVSWADAFEDLISFERTGKMPNREVEGRVHPRNMTSSWIRDMIEKGLLGPKWWVENGEIRRDSRDDPRIPFSYHRRDKTPTEGDRILREASIKANTEISALIPEYIALVDKHMKSQQYTEQDWNDDSKIVQSPTEHLETLQKVLPNGPAQYTSPKYLERAVQPPTENLRISQQGVSSNQALYVSPESLEKNTISSQPSPTDSVVTPAPTQSKQQLAQVSTPKRSLTSTLTTTTSRTLPDGSVETRRVLKKRFADGMEESEESTEVIHPQTPEPISGKNSSERQKSPGWFWT